MDVSPCGSTNRTRQQVTNREEFTMSTQPQIIANRPNAQDRRSAEAESTAPNHPRLASGPVPEVATEQNKTQTRTRTRRGYPMWSPSTHISQRSLPTPGIHRRGNEPEILSAVPIYRGCTSGRVKKHFVIIRANSWLIPYNMPP